MSAEGAAESAGAGAPGGVASRLAGIRAHLSDPLYRTGYLLMATTVVAALLGLGFWAVAARIYSARDVGVSSAAISAMSFVSGLAQLGLSSLLTRWVPTAGRHTRGVVLGSYAAAFATSLVLGAAAAVTSPLWSHTLAFIAHNRLWALGFTFAVPAWTIFGLQDQVITGLRSTHIVLIEGLTYAVVKIVALVAMASVASVASAFLAFSFPVPFGVAVINWIIFTRLIPRKMRQIEERTNSADDVEHADRPATLLAEHSDIAPVQPVSRVPSRREVIRAVSANWTGSIFLQIVSFLTPVIMADLVGPVREAYFYTPWTVLLALNALTANTMTALTVEASLDERNLYPLARRALINSWLTLTPAVVIIVAGAGIILKIDGGTYASAGAPVMRLLAISLFPSAVTSVAMAVARIQHRNGWLLFIQIVPAVIQVGLTIGLVHLCGISSAGWAQIASDGFGAVVMFATIMRPVIRRPVG